MSRPKLWRPNYLPRFACRFSAARSRRLDRTVTRMRQRLADGWHWTWWDIPGPGEHAPIKPSTATPGRRPHRRSTR